MADLRVELYGHLVGFLAGADWREFKFRSDPNAFDNFELGSTILSESIPLFPVIDANHAKRHRNFFAELLPEGRILTNLATRVGLQEYDTIGLLAHYGRDVAGAIQIWDPEKPDEPRSPAATPISASGLEVLLSNTSASPLGNRPISGKSSLAGVQDKIVLAHLDSEWNQVHDGFPSTHILKPEPRDTPTMIYDEEYGCRIARLLGLATHKTSIEQFNSVNALVIERYDRTVNNGVERIHQEDMNQVLGARGEQKYQKYGGKVTFKKITDVFSKYGDDNALVKVLEFCTLAVAIGNLDLHAKNISVLHQRNGEMQLAPAYDVVPLRHFDNDQEIALAVNGKYLHKTITANDIVAEGSSWGIRNATTVVETTLNKIRLIVESEVPHELAHPGLAGEILDFTNNLIAGNPAG